MCKRLRHQGENGVPARLAGGGRRADGVRLLERGEATLHHVKPRRAILMLTGRHFESQPADTLDATSKPLAP